jgi:hypothetical protein
MFTDLAPRVRRFVVAVGPLAAMALVLAAGHRWF